jgi:hypothetical protein
MVGTFDEAILEELAAHDTAAAAVDRFLYRGVPEPFEPTLRANEGDRCLWLAFEPSVAQTYIPASGTKELLAVQSFRLDESVRPTFNGRGADGALLPSAFYAAALQFGFPAATGVEVEEWGGSARSWGIPPGYPTYRQVVERFAAMGYGWDGRDFRAWAKSSGGAYRPEDWREPGNLMIVDGWQGLRLYDWATGREGDLTDCDYHKVEFFRELEREGWDGVVLHDFCQTENHGNVGHRSVGVFAGAAGRLRWAAVPARHWEWEGLGGDWRGTEEFENAWEAARSRAPSPGGPR